MLRERSYVCLRHLPFEPEVYFCSRYPRLLCVALAIPPGHQIFSDRSFYQTNASTFPILPLIRTTNQ